jgi:hypothetical protein
MAQIPEFPGKIPMEKEIKISAVFMRDSCFAASASNHLFSFVMAKRVREDDYELRSRTKKAKGAKAEEKEEEVEDVRYEGPRNKSGQYHGVGKLTLIDEGVSYEGTFKNGNRHGQGPRVILFL